MFNFIKKLLTKTFVQQKKKKQITTRKEKEKEKEPTTTEPPSLTTSSFEPSYIEPSSEPVIKRTQRALKYRY